MFEDGRLDDTRLDESTMKAVAKAMREAEKKVNQTLWSGGGGFRHVRIGPSMFDLDTETGDVFLAEWATNGAFSEADRKSVVSGKGGSGRVDHGGGRSLKK